MDPLDKVFPIPPETLLLPGMPDDNLRLKRDQAIAALAIGKRITLADASDLLFEMTRKAEQMVREAVGNLK